MSLKLRKLKNKKASDWTIGMIMSLILGIVLVILIVVGLITGELLPLFSKIKGLFVSVWSYFPHAEKPTPANLIVQLKVGENTGTLDKRKCELTLGDSLYKVVFDKNPRLQIWRVTPTVILSYYSYGDDIFSFRWGVESKKPEIAMSINQVGGFGGYSYPVTSDLSKDTRFMQGSKVFDYEVTEVKDIMASKNWEELVQKVDAIAIARGEDVKVEKSTPEYWENIENEQIKSLMQKNCE